jgi:hypothetical protein
MRPSSKRMFHAAMLCAIAACAHLATSQTNTDSQVAATSGPAAYVYVSSGPFTGPDVVNAFTAAANGKLTAVPGSPFHDDVRTMAANGKYLFGGTTNGIYVAAFQIGSNGALHWTASTNVARYNPGACNYFADPLVLDHTGADLYLEATVGDCEHTEYQTFSIDQANGKLNFLGSSGLNFLYNAPLRFSGNNVYAYATGCVNFQNVNIDTFQILKRGSNGFLTDSGISAAEPPAKNSGEFYCRAALATDPTNHVAVAVERISLSLARAAGRAQLATYTRDSYGNLTTTSTSANMPATAMDYIFSLSMSPSGKLLAVGGEGLQIFHFNGGAPITHYIDVPLPMFTFIHQMFWDNANHLYVLTDAKLYVFTVTPTAFSQASGSPYSISNPHELVVQPKTP